MNRHTMRNTQSIHISTADYPRAPLLIFVIFLVWVWGRYIEIGVRGGGLLGAVRFEFTIGTLLILLCLPVLAATPLSIMRSKYVICGITLLLVTMVVQIPFAARPSLAQGIFVDRVVKFAFLTVFIAVLVRSPKAMMWFVVVWMVSIFWITAESVRGLLSGSLVWQNQGISRLHGAVPIYFHPNSLAGVSMGAVPFIVFLWPVWRRWWQRFALLALLVTSMVCVIFSGSRTAYVAILSFLVFWFVRSRHKVRWLVLALVLTPIALIALPQEYKDRFQTIGAEEEDGSTIARKQILRDAWDVFLDNPGGVGLGCFPVVRAVRFGRSQDTHNLYLEVATNLGIQGFLVFMFFVGAMMTGSFSAYRAYQRQVESLRRIQLAALPRAMLTALKVHRANLEFLKAVANATAGFIFIRLVLGGFGMDLYEIYWWFGAGITISLVELIDRTSQRTRSFNVAQGNSTV
jgi:putative inorganic carbon (HCO3(-)) transporter